MDSSLIEIIFILAGGVSLPSVLLIYLLFFPEKIEKLAALFWKVLYRLGLFAKYARKTFVKHDVQSHVNDFVRRTTRDVPGLYARGVRLEWEKPEETSRQSFLRDGEVIIRLSHKNSDAENIAISVYLFVSTSLLHRAKRYISPSQGQATDLFVTKKLLQQQKPDVVEYFLETYLHPGLEGKKGKPLQLYEKFEQIDRVGLFFPLFLREVDYLGQKIFGHPRKDQAIGEIDDLINHLNNVSQRAVGEKQELNFQRNYCKIGIMIVGKSFKIRTSLEPYIKYIQNSLEPSNIESLYMIGHVDNVEAIRRIAAEVRDTFEEIAAHKFTGQIRRHGEVRSTPSYLLVLRARNRPLVVSQPGADSDQHSPLVQ